MRRLMRTTTGCSSRRASGASMPIPRIRTCQASICVRGSACGEGLFMNFVSFIQNSDGTPLYENAVQYAILKKEWDQLAKPTINNTVENGLMEA